MPIEWPAETNAQKIDEEVRKVLLQEYTDYGNWARHFSTVRMTLGTFFVTAATGMITLRWDNPQPGVAALAAGVFLLGAGLFVAFTYLTVQSMNRQLDIVDSYKARFQRPEMTARRSDWKKFWRLRTGWPVAVLFLLAFAALDFWWLHYSKPAANSTITVPVKVTIGESEKVITVPLKVTAP